MVPKCSLTSYPAAQHWLLLIMTKNPQLQVVMYYHHFYINNLCPEFWNPQKICNPNFSSSKFLTLISPIISSIAIYFSINFTFPNQGNVPPTFSEGAKILNLFLNTLFSFFQRIYGCERLMDSKWWFYIHRLVWMKKIWGWA